MWWWLQSANLSVLPGDEGIYLYGAHLFSEGTMPYSGYFLAHPPLRIVLAGALMWLGVPLVGVKILALAAPPVGALLVGIAVLRPARIGGALLAVFLYLFGWLTMEVGGIWLGPSVAAAIVAGALAAAAHGRFLLSGILLSVGAGQALYALMPVPVICAWAWRDGQLKRFAIGMSTALVGFLIAWIWFGGAFVDQVFAYHVRKVTSDDIQYPVHRLLAFVYGDLGLLLMATLALLDRRPVARWFLAGAALCFVVPASYKSLIVYYFLIGVPFLAGSGAIGAARVYAWSESRTPAVRLSILVLLGAGIVMTYGPHFQAAVDRDAAREEQAREVEELVEAISARRPASGLLWGDSAIVPLLALRTEMTVAGGFVDMNAKRFDSGTSDPAEVLSSVFADAGQAPGVVTIDRHGVLLVAPLRDHIRGTLAETYSIWGYGTAYNYRYWLSPRDARRVIRSLRDKYRHD